MDTLLDIRPLLPVVLLLVFIGAEYLIPFMRLPNIWHHRAHNLGLGLLNALITYFLIPISLVSLANGLINDPWPLSLSSLFNTHHWAWQVVCFITLECAIYWQHRLSHTIPTLWRLHRVHHTETQMNTTSALRFHTLEIIASLAFKVILIIILAPHPITVVFFEMFLNGMALFHHTNIKLPTRLEKFIRLFFVTPAMHRIHHSPIKHETNSNYGFSFSFWDKVFLTYNGRSLQADNVFIFGLETSRSKKEQHIKNLLLQTFNKTI